MNTWATTFTENNFLPNCDFFHPLLGILPTRSGYFALTAKNSKFSHQLSSEVTSCHHLSIIIITSYQVSSSIIDQPIWTCFIEHVSAPDVTKIPMYALKSSKITYQDPFWNVWIPITTPSIVREPFGELFESQIQT